MIQRTLAIIKPEAVARGQEGTILTMIQGAGLRLAAVKLLHLTERQAAAFYEMHRERPFFSELVAYMTSGPVVCAVLEGEDAVSVYRTLMGATDPAKAAEGTIRRIYGESVAA
ncbi:MAG: nucleoside-diphosphate kinase, partial [Mailhella sp.]|nr:nucleoside-diphosphate kinase [Mailhella sp.]